MKLRDCRFLADENIDPEVVRWLNALSVDIRSVNDLGLCGATDVDLLQIALAETRVIITHDSDFGTLCVLQNHPVYGILFLRPGHIDPGFTISTLKTLFELDPHLEVPFLAVARRAGSKVAVRLRSLKPSESDE